MPCDLDKALRELKIEYVALNNGQKFLDNKIKSKSLNQEHGLNISLSLQEKYHAMSVYLDSLDKNIKQLEAYQVKLKED